VVALLMPNCPEYMAIWLGITRAGGIVALVNANLAGPALAHAINIVVPKHVIVGAALVDAFVAIRPRLPTPVQSWAHGPGTHHFPRIDHEIQRTAGDRLQGSECELPSIMHRALYI